MLYTNVYQYGNQLLIRGYKGNSAVKAKISFNPKLFVHSTKSITQYKSLHGRNLEEIEFASINEAKDYISRYKDIENFPIYGQTKFAYQWITENNPSEIEFDISQLKIWSIDIETEAENGFPSPKEANEKVLLISLQDYNSKQIKTYGVTEYQTSDAAVTYIQCKSETDLLKRFLEDMQHGHPDIITGWNCEFFDIAYLANRINKILGPAWQKKLSPWGIIREKIVDRQGRADVSFDIAGITVLDYLDLYKKFTYSAQESYKLDYIAKIELGKEKLSYDEFDSFRDFYRGNWQKFVDYNIVDVRLVDELEDKMKLIELIITMAYDAKCNYSDVFSSIRTWDCLLYNHLWQKNIVIHQKDYTPATSIAGAYVKEPKPGLYKWIVSFDATSLYPSIIMQYNMSPETLVEGEFVDCTVDDLLQSSLNLDRLKQDDICMTANGHCFRRGEQGLFPEIVEKIFAERLTSKKKMLVAQRQYEETKDRRLLRDISKYNNIQMAKKIQLNSLYGAMGNEHFRFYDSRIAEGITLTGQYIIQAVAKQLNTYLNQICQTKDFEYVFYMDTDSCYVTLNPLIEKYYSKQSIDKIVDIIDQISKEKITPKINEACDELAEYTNAFQKRIDFKRESIADRGAWIAKKRYAVNVYDNEGVRYNDPKIKIMGLEIVRSSTPGPVRKTLKAAVKIVLQGSELELQQFIKTTEADYLKLSPEEIAFPRGVNGMSKYGATTEIYTKGTPMHVRGALLYNHYIKDKKLTKKYELIREGDKIRFLYLCEPNPVKENCIAFTGKLPAELGLTKFVDYNIMFEKSFLSPLDTIVSAVGWKVAPTASLEDLFA